VVEGSVLDAGDLDIPDPLEGDGIALVKFQDSSNGPEGAPTKKGLDGLQIGAVGEKRTPELGPPGQGNRPRVGGEGDRALGGVDEKTNGYDLRVHEAPFLAGQRPPIYTNSSILTTKQSLQLSTGV